MLHRCPFSIDISVHFSYSNPVPCFSFIFGAFLTVTFATYLYSYRPFPKHAIYQIITVVKRAVVYRKNWFERFTATIIKMGMVAHLDLTRLEDVNAPY